MLHYLNYKNISTLIYSEYNEDTDKLPFAKASPDVVENTNENKEHNSFKIEDHLIWFV